MKTHADNLEQQIKSILYGKTGFKNFKGRSDGIVLKIACIQSIAGVNAFIAKLLVTIQIIAEKISIAAIKFGLVKGPIGIFHKLVVGIAGCVFRQKANTNAAAKGIRLVEHFHIVDVLHKTIELLD